VRTSSRQSKEANKRRVRATVVYDHDEKGKRIGKRKGPAKTTPVHGKRNRWPYDAEARKKMLTKGNK
jgi:hypothetical protein